MIEHILTAETPGPVAGNVRYRLMPDVAVLLLEDRSARVLNLNGHFYALSETAADFLDELLQTDPDTATRRMAERYQADVHRIRQDLESCIQTFLQTGVIRPAPGSESDRQPRTAIVLMGLLRMVHRLRSSPETQAGWLLLLAYIAIRRWGWPATVRCWQRYYRDRGRESVALGNQQEWIDRVEAAVRTATARHLLPVAYKERALCGWGLLRAHGLPATLVLGIELFPLASHCWCQLRERVVGDLPERCARFTPVTSYG